MEVALSKPIFLTFPSLNQTIGFGSEELQREGMLIEKVVLPYESPLVQSEKDMEQYLRRIALVGFEQNYNLDEQKACKLRFVEELNIIIEKGWASYFVVLHSLIGEMKQFTNQANFSANHTALGSVVNYCLGITNTDPIKNDLAFEKFLNPEELMVTVWAVDSIGLRNWFIALNNTLPRSYETAKSVLPRGNAKSSYHYNQLKKAEKIVFIVCKYKTGLQNVINSYL